MAGAQNAAYDLSLFEARAPRPPRKQLRVIRTKNPRPSIKGAVAKWTCIAALVMAGLRSLIVANVRIMELNNDIVKAKSRLTQAQSEQVRLNMALETRMSLKNAESIASGTLGMQKIQSGQVHYITPDNTDRVDISAGGEGNGVLGSFHRFLANLQELLR